MATISNSASAPPSSANDLPPPYSAVVGNPQYGFVAPQAGQPFPPPDAAYGFPKQFTPTPTGVYPHAAPAPQTAVYTHAPTIMQPQAGDFGPPLPPGPQLPVGVVMSPAVGTEPATITCFNCHKTVTTKVTYSTAWHTHLVAGSVCVTTLVCSLCCLGLVPYCFDSFKDAEHYCPNCNTFLGKYNRC